MKIATFDREKARLAAHRQHYIDRVPTDELLYEMEIQLQHAQHFYEAIPAEKLEYRYALGKWNLRELLQHVIDFERINECRALLITRGESFKNVGFDIQNMVKRSNAANRPLSSMLVEWAHVRRSIIGLFHTLDMEMLLQEGQMGEEQANALGIGYLIVGHEMHHRAIFAERYLIDS